MSIIDSVGKGLPPVMDFNKAQGKKVGPEEASVLDSKPKNSEVLDETPVDIVTISQPSSNLSLTEEEPVEVATPSPPRMSLEDLKKKVDQTKLSAERLTKATEPPVNRLTNYVHKRAEDMMNVLKERAKPKEIKEPKEVEVRSILGPSKYGPNSAKKPEDL